MNYQRQKHFAIPCLLISMLLTVPLISCSTIGAKKQADDPGDFQYRMDRGRAFLKKRKHSLALKEFIDTGRLYPSHPEPFSGQARALFHMARYEETLSICSKLDDEFPKYFTINGFCWGARLEAGRANETVKEKVRQEIGNSLDRSDPPLELLYSAYTGFYYLKDKEKRFALIQQLSEQGAGSSLAGAIASNLFEEIIESGSNKERREKLAKIYIRNFPDEKMADKAAAIVLENFPAKQENKFDHHQAIRSVLNNDESHPLLNIAVAHWLIEQDKDPALAARLLLINLDSIKRQQKDIPEQPEKITQAEKIEHKRMLYTYLLGRVRLGQRETGKAKRLFEEVISIEPDWSGPYHFLGMIALGEGRYEHALEFLKTSMIKGSPRPETYSELRTLLADHYGFNGDPLEYFQAQNLGPGFTDVTESSGLSGIKAGRVAWGDYDNDGDDDLLLDGTRIFTNLGNGSFVPAPAGIIPEEISGSNGGIWGDYDNDGFLDIFVTSHGGNILLHNENGAIFSKSPAFPKDNVTPRTEGSSWGDINNDGFLDLYVANYEHGAVIRALCNQDQFYINLGGKIFADVTTSYGIVSEEGMCGRGVTWSDLNNDGWQDILVANYRLDPNFLWMNQGEGSFIDIAETAGVQGDEVQGSYGHSIGSVTGDLDGDGDLDIFTSNLAHPRYIEFSDKSMVLFNNGEHIPEFTNRYDESGIPFDETSSDPVLFDADLDGDLDLFVTSIYRNRSSHFYMNDGNGVFTDRTWLAGAGVSNGWGTASADFDNDGYPDLLIASSDGIHLLRNEGGSNNWLSIRIEDQNCNRFGVGSKITVSYNGKSLLREITAGRGTGSQDSMTINFGLGQYQGPVTVEVRTLCGDILTYQTSELNRILKISNR